MAAVRAVTIAATIQLTRAHVTGTTSVASNAPVSANGRANTVWLNRIKDAYVRMRLNIVMDKGTLSLNPPDRRAR